MSGNKFKLPTLFLAALLIAQSPAATAAGDPPEGETTPAGNDSESAAVKKSEEDLEQLEDELQLESANRGTVLLDTSDRVMEISRAPLTYIQEKRSFPNQTKYHLFWPAGIGWRQLQQRSAQR